MSQRDQISAFFRTVNERIVESVSPEELAVELVCECASLSCVQRVSILPSEFHTRRAASHGPILAPVHDVTGSER